MNRKPITQRTNSEIANDICQSDLDWDDIIKIILEIDQEQGCYDFTFSLIKSLLEAAKEEDEFTQKEIKENITKAKLVKLYE